MSLKKKLSLFKCSLTGLCTFSELTEDQLTANAENISKNITANEGKLKSDERNWPYWFDVFRINLLPNLTQPRLLSIFMEVWWPRCWSVKMRL